jgi:hypothetical protein
MNTLTNPRKHATVKETFAIGALLEKRLVVDKSVDPAICVYTPGWDDERVAAEIGPHITIPMIVRIRAGLFGILKGKTFKTSPKVQAARMDDLEKRVEELEAKFTAPAAKALVNLVK